MSQNDFMYAKKVSFKILYWGALIKIKIRNFKNLK